MQGIYKVRDLAPLIIKDYDKIGASAAEQQVRRLVKKGIIKTLTGEGEGIRISRIEVLRHMGTL